MGFLNRMHLLQEYTNGFRVQVMPRGNYVTQHLIQCLDVECPDAHPFSFEEHAQYVHDLHEQ